MNRDELRHAIALIQWELDRLDALFPKGHWLRECRSRCNACKHPKGLYCIVLQKPDLSGRSPMALTEIIDMFCTQCGDCRPQLSLIAIEPEHATHAGLPQQRKEELCSKCISSDVVGIWRGLNPTAAECRNCGKLEVPTSMRRVARKYRAMVRLRRNKLNRELCRLLAIQTPQIFKDPFAPSKK